MTTWNYRLVDVGEHFADPADPRPWLFLVEAYYEDGADEPTSFRKAAVCGETGAEVLATLDAMREAVERPRVHWSRDLVAEWNATHGEFA